ncbi:Hypothetical protein I595_279 [Croceitalea dokdonensis DOKDO 023]|uniref:Uncharacterized protein n=1 Tax=Croceitalea dokdonensis DOKDO 023 TaxID=1300341 RepID=A0A0P7AIF0_9FLAO|nr:hypothetical protein [Croceitalea dokdonensis]KPM33376.1 Hypothetical protein I595_279 [Croceitalea dokdonensis DOKDO 023]
MKKIIYLPVLLLLFLNTSCSEDDEAEEIRPSLTGSWSGTYSGDDRGNWTVNVSSTGNVSGTATSSFTQDSADITGKVSDTGNLSATIGITDDHEFFGQLGENNEASGTWIDTQRDQNGTWTGTKD